MLGTWCKGVLTDWLPVTLRSLGDAVVINGVIDVCEASDSKPNADCRSKTCYWIYLDTTL